MLIDTHAHMDFPEFDHIRHEIFQKMHANGIKAALIPAINSNNWVNVQQIAKRFHCYYALGIHPWYSPLNSNEINAQLMQLTHFVKEQGKDKCLVAIGESGLDKLKGATIDLQITLLIGQIAIANQYQLPILLHCVKAHTQLIHCLKSQPVQKKGVIHGFTGSAEIAKEYTKLGFKLGIGGMLLMPNFKKLHQTVLQLPLNSFVVETDSPAMSPFIGQLNTPLTILQVIDKIASIKKISTQLVRDQLSQNAIQLFEL